MIYPAHAKAGPCRRRGRRRDLRRSDGLVAGLGAPANDRRRTALPDRCSERAARRGPRRSQQLRGGCAYGGDLRPGSTARDRARLGHVAVARTGDRRPARDSIGPRRPPRRARGALPSRRVARLERLVVVPQSVAARRYGAPHRRTPVRTNGALRRLPDLPRSGRRHRGHRAGGLAVGGSTLRAHAGGMVRLLALHGPPLVAACQVPGSDGRARGCRRVADPARESRRERQPASCRAPGGRRARARGPADARLVARRRLRERARTKRSRGPGVTLAATVPGLRRTPSGSGPGHVPAAAAAAAGSGRARIHAAAGPPADVAVAAALRLPHPAERAAVVRTFRRRRPGRPLRLVRHVVVGDSPSGYGSSPSAIRSPATSAR